MLVDKTIKKNLKTFNRSNRKLQILLLNINTSLWMSGPAFFNIYQLDKSSQQHDTHSTEDILRMAILLCQTLREKKAPTYESQKIEL